MIVTSMAHPLMHETVWLDKYKYDDAEKKFEEEAAQQRKEGCISEPAVEMNPQSLQSSLAEEIANARQHILNTLQSGDIHIKSTGGHKDYETLAKKFEKLECENKDLRKKPLFLESDDRVVYEGEEAVTCEAVNVDGNSSEIDLLYVTVRSLHNVIQQVQAQVQSLSDRLTTMEKASTAAPKETKVVKEEKKLNSVVNNNHTGGDEDDDIDLFGSDEEDETANQLREERLKAYEKKKSKKAPLVAKSSVVLDIKPWDDETDMKEMEVRVRQIDCDGLKWGASKLVPLAYGIKKLQIVSVVEDDKVSIDWLQETIQDTIDDLVQSVDIAAFNKL